MKVKFEVIKLADDMFVIKRTRKSLFKKQVDFVSRNGEYFWDSLIRVKEYCVFDEEQKAEKQKQILENFYMEIQ